MKIDGFKTCRISAPLERELVNSSYSINSFEHIFVEIFAEGFTGTGYGYSFSRPYADIMCQLANIYCEKFVGKSAHMVRRHWRDTCRGFNSIGQAGLQVSAYAAVDTALWDLYAQSLNLPLYRLLGGSVNTLEVYVSGGWLGSCEDLVKEAEECVAQGYRKFKIRLGPDIQNDLKRISAVKKTVGDALEIMTDANQGYDFKQAVQAAKLLEEHGVTWLEEPICPHDYAANADLCRRCDIRIVSGESLFTHMEHFQLLQAKGADVLMPDLRRVGGITEYMDIATLASMYDIPLCSHVFPHVCAHILSAAPTGTLLEHVPGWWSDVFETAPPIKEGRIFLDDIPGHGIKLNHQFAQTYATG